MYFFESIEKINFKSFMNTYIFKEVVINVLGMSFCTHGMSFCTFGMSFCTFGMSFCTLLKFLFFNANF